MSAPTGSTCTSSTNGGTGSLPATVKNLDNCMTNIEDSTCTASYGKTANLINSGGKSVVGWIEQLSMKLIVLFFLNNFLFRKTFNDPVHSRFHNPNLWNPNINRCNHRWV